MKWVLALLLVAGTATTAFADEAQEARTRYEKGTTLYDLGQYIEAAHEYEAAFKLRQSPPLLFNIGQAYRLGGEYGSALRAYRSYLRRSPEAANRAEVSGYIAACEKRLADKGAKAAPEPAHATPAAPAPTPAPTVATAPAPAVVTPAPAPAASPPSSPALQLSRAPSDRSAPTPVYKKWWLWTTVAVVVAGGVGVGLGLGLTQRKDVAIPAGAHPVQF
jgi:tetratricopeptide (TPR) repeat protein